MGSFGFNMSVTKVQVHADVKKVHHLVSWFANLHGNCYNGPTWYQIVNEEAGVNMCLVLLSCCQFAILIKSETTLVCNLPAICNGVMLQISRAISRVLRNVLPLKIQMWFCSLLSGDSSAQITQLECTPFCLLSLNCVHDTKPFLHYVHV